MLNFPKFVFILFFLNVYILTLEDAKFHIFKHRPIDLARNISLVRAGDLN
jgi:hypothetical protein